MSKRLQYGIVTASTCLLLTLMLGIVLGRGRAADDGTNAYRHFAVFSEVISRIKSEYVEEPDMKSVTLGALNGMLESIDPYASYLSGDQYKQYLKAKESRQADVGLVLYRRYGYIGIIDSIPGSPAYQEGLTTGDVIELIDGVSTRDMPLAYAEILLRGEPGTTVKLAVMRVRRGAEAEEIGLIRRPVGYPAPQASMINNEIGYLKVRALDAGQTKDVAARVRELDKKGAKKLILDLRFNAVGEPQEGIALANLFLDSGTITYAKGQKVARKEYAADGASTITRLPMVVIANRGTGAAAEIATSALLGLRRAEVVGERTFGFASERKAVTMEDGSAVILSVAKYYGSDDKPIQDSGVTPSVPVVLAEAGLEADEAVPPVEPPPSEDDMLRKAVDVLTLGVEASRNRDALRARQRSQQQEPGPARPETLPPLTITPVN